jgi:RNA polymerase sigma factor, sigma-70 family
MNEKIYDEHAKTVYYFLLSLCHNPHTAQDLTQETFLRAYQSMDRFDGTCKLSVWLCQIAKHLWYQHLDKHKHEELKSPEDDTALSIDTETQVFAKYDLIQVLKELHNLPEQMREVIYIKMSSELTFREIGEILGKSENWARVTYFRGKEKIMKGLMKNE